MKPRYIRGVSKKRLISLKVRLKASDKIFLHYDIEYMEKMQMGELIVVCQARGISITLTGDEREGITHSYILRSRLRTWQVQNTHCLCDEYGYKHYET